MTVGALPYVAKSFSYDASGQVNGLTLPRSYNAISTIDHDLEGNVMSFAPVNYNPITYRYSSRNEASGASNVAYYADGSQCAWDPLHSSQHTCQFDSRSGQLLQSYDAGTQTNQANTATHTYGYDAAGRQITDNAVTCSAFSPSFTGTSTRTYDADNRIIQQSKDPNYHAGTPDCANTLTQTSGSTTLYTWGADGRLASTAPANGGATYTLTPHWDGDDLLYTTSPYGGLQLYIYIEKLGVMYCSSANNCALEQVYDRDWSGTAVNTHDETGYPALSLDTLHSQYCNFNPKSGSCSPTAAPAKDGGASDPSYSAILTPPLDAIRTDGYSDGTNVFQGVRAYDPNMNQWTTPDAYAGDVHDPMSQKPYMWNGNNPIAYSDPSGYCIGPLIAVCAWEGWVTVSAIAYARRSRWACGLCRCRRRC